jgi:hypothetical protein
MNTGVIVQYGEGLCAQLHFHVRHTHLLQ